MAQRHRRREMERLLRKRERRGLTYRELSEESGVPVPTLSWPQHESLAVFDEEADEHEQLTGPGHGAEIVPGIGLGSNGPVRWRAESPSKRALGARSGFSVATAPLPTIREDSALPG